jgi:hypothetical protein
LAEPGGKRGRLRPLARRWWKAPGRKPREDRAARLGTSSGEGLGRRRRCRGRPIPGDHPTTTKVSELLRTGAIGEVAQGRARQGSTRSSGPRGFGRARQSRSPRAGKLHRCVVDRRATGGSRAGAGRPEREAGGPRGFGAQSHGNTEPPQRPTCPGRAGNTARFGEKTPRGRSAHCAPRVDDTAEALFVTRSCSSSNGTGLVIGQQRRGTRTGSPVRANANERRLAERGRKTDANARTKKGASGLSEAKNRSRGLVEAA